MEQTDRWRIVESYFVMMGAFIEVSNWVMVGSFGQNIPATQLVHILPLTRFCLLSGFVLFAISATIFNVLVMEFSAGPLQQWVSEWLNILTSE